MAPTQDGERTLSAVGFEAIGLLDRQLARLEGGRLHPAGALERVTKFVASSDRRVVCAAHPAGRPQVDVSLWRSGTRYLVGLASGGYVRFELAEAAAAFALVLHALEYDAEVPKEQLRLAPSEARVAALASAPGRVVLTTVNLPAEDHIATIAFATIDRTLVGTLVVGSDQGATFEAPRGTEPALVLDHLCLSL